MSGTSGGSFGVGNATDVAALSFAINSSQVVTAAQSLDGLKTSSDGVQDSYDKLTERSQRFIAVARDMGESISQMRRQFQDTSQSLDGLLASLDQARAKLDGTQASFAALSDAAGHVTALGSSFGVTSQALEAFSAQSSMLGLSAGQTTLALQRITEALQNQTLAGQQVRQEIQGLGIDLAGLGANDSAGVLASVVSRLRTTQDGLGKYQTESSILGVTDPNALYTLNNADYVPVSQRREIAYRQSAQRQIGSTTDLVARDERGFYNQDAENSDLGQYYRIGSGVTNATNPFAWTGLAGGLSNAQKAQLAQALGLPSDDSFTDPDSQNAAFRYFQANPDSSFAQSALRPTARIGNYLRNSYAGGEYRHLTDGTFGSNQADIQDQYDFASRQNSGFLGLNIGNFATAQYRELANVFNGYTPQPNTGDTRPIDGDTAIRNNQVAAQTLSGFGDGSLNEYQSIAATLRRLSDPSTIGVFQSAYGDVQGAARFGNTQYDLQRRQQLAITPGGVDQDAADQQAYLLGQPENQRGELQALIKFMQQNGGGASALYSGSSPISLEGALNLDGSGGGPGVLNGNGQGNPLAQAFLKLFKTQAANAATELLQELDKRNTQSFNVLSASGGNADDPVALATSRFEAETFNAYNNLSPVQRSGTSYESYRQRQVATASLAGQQRAQDQFNTESLTAGDAAIRAGQAQLGVGDNGDLQNLIKLNQDYAQALAAAARQGPDAVDSLNKLIDGIARLQRQAAYSDFETKNYGQAQSSNTRAQFDAYIAGAPVGQRAGLQADEGILTQPGFNPVLQRHNDLSSADLQTIQQQASAIGLDPSLFGVATSIPRLEGATDRPDLPLLQQFGLTQGAITDLSGQGYNVDPTSRTSVIGGYLRYLQQQGRAFPGNPGAAGLAYNTGANAPGLQRFAASGDLDQSGLTADQQTYAQGLGFYTPQQLEAAGRNDPAVSANLRAGRAAQAGGYNVQIADLSSQSAGRDSIEQQILQLLSNGQTAQEKLLEAGINQNPGTPVGAYEAGQRVQSTQRGFNETIVSNAASTQQQIDQAKQLADAYLQGGDAAAQASAKIQAHKEALATNMTAAQENARAQQLVAQALAQEGDAMAKQAAAVGRDGQRASFIGGLGVTDDYDRQFQIGQYDYVQQQRQANPVSAATDPNFDQAQKSQFALIQQQKDLLTSTDAVNNAFDSMGKSIFTTFENAAFSGQRFKKTLGELLQQISQIILNLTIEKPLENAFSSGVGGIFGTSLNNVAGGASGGGGGFGGLGPILGGLGNYFGLTSAAASTSIVSSATIGNPILDTIGFARGGVFGPSGRISYHASGSVLPGPTPFTDASGGANIAGEAGPEAIMPLQVLPNGSLGIATAGGGGGQQIIVHTPITYNAGGGPGGDVDPATLKRIQAQITKAATEATKQTLLQQQRPGGMLYGTSQSGS